MLNYKDFHKLSNTEQWRFLLENKEHFKVYLDNDYTFMLLKEDDEDDEDSDSYIFRKHIGNSHGVFILLKELGIDVESV